MGLTGRISFLLVIVLSTLANAYYAHPFMDTAAGTVWEYKYYSNSYGFNMGAGTNTSNLKYGTISITNLNSTGAIRVTIKGIDSSSFQSMLKPGTDKNVLKVVDTSFGAASVEALVLDSLCGSTNPFCIDSLFIGDTSGKKGAGTFSTSASVFKKVVFLQDSLFAHVVLHSKGFAGGDVSSFSGDSATYLQKYGLTSRKSWSSFSGMGYSKDSNSFVLAKFNGKTFDESRITVIRPVPMVEMERYYPAYAVHGTNISAPLLPQHSHSSQLFSAQSGRGRVVLFAATPAAYSLSIADALGKTTRILQGNSPVFPIEFNTPGVYILTMRSGGTKQSAAIRVW
jgi:hypothetical protein